MLHAFWHDSATISIAPLFLQQRRNYPECLGYLLYNGFFTGCIEIKSRGNAGGEFASDCLLTHACAYNCLAKRSIVPFTLEPFCTTKQGHVSLWSSLFHSLPLFSGGDDLESIFCTHGIGFTALNQLLNGSPATHMSVGSVSQVRQSNSALQPCSLRLSDL